MKNTSVKILAGVGAIAIAAAVYSFAADNNPNEPVMKKYEVIRMVNGQMTQYDTVVDIATGYSPEDYLNDLGFGNDEAVNIINICNFDPEKMITMQHMNDETGPQGEKMIFIEMNADENKVVEDNGEQHEIRIEKRVISSDGEEIVVEEGNHPEIVIEKRIVVNAEGEELTEDLNMTVEGLVEGLNIDSMIQVALAMHQMEGDSHKVVMHKVMVTDERTDGEATFEWHQMDSEGATYHKEISGDNHHVEVAFWGDDTEDFTLVIVSDPDESPTRTAGADGESGIKEMKVYPNPAKSTSQLQLNFKTKENTIITVTDIQGKTVAKIELGKFKGQFNHELDVEKWEKGVYLIHVAHGDDTIIEKLIVE